MTEERISFLYNVALQLNQQETPNLLLQSYYLMRCQDITRGYGLPQKQFSELKRCSHCFLEWKRGNYETKIKPLKLSKKQRRRIKHYKPSKGNEERTKAKKDLLNCNQMERKCLFCSKITVIQTAKPVTEKVVTQKCINEKLKNVTVISKQACTKNNTILKRKSYTDVYSQSKDVFSLQNKNNTISSNEIVEQKVIKNNKRKKDRFAGLCKEAVQASAKVKKMNEAAATNNLNLFLRPSS